MTNKAKPFGMLIGAFALAVPVLAPSSVEANTVMMQPADPDDYARTRTRDGIEVLRPTDEEHTNEQATFAFDIADKTKGIVVMMSTGQLDGPQGPHTGDTIEVGNIQGACMPFQMVKDETADSGVSLERDLANYKYVSQRNSDENRAYHHPEVEAIGNGYFAITQNWDRNNNTNTERYIQVVDSSCNLMPLTGNITLRENNTSGVIMAKNNDNCSGRQAGGGASTYIDSTGMAHITSAELCNGNGADDGWWNYITVQCENGSCDVQKKDDTSFIDQEERSRGRCEQLDTDADTVPDMSVCCGTEGNSQPQRDGVWCSGIDHASGDEIWKEQVSYRGETESGQRTYAMRIKMLAEKTVAGNNTGKVYMEWQMHRGNNNNNAKGGYDDKIMSCMATPNRNGLNLPPECQDITNHVIDTQTPMTHSTLFQTFTGSAENPISTFAFLAPNHNGGGGVNSTVMLLPMNANGIAETASVYYTQGPTDGQKYSKYLGDNPNNQGRNYTDCHVVPNPFVADNTSKTAGIPVINMCAMTGKLSSAGVPSMKPDLFFEIWTSLEAPASEEPGTEEPGTEEPEEPGTEEPGTEEPSEPGTGNGNQGFSSGGCSTSGGGMGGIGGLLLGLALVAIRRRRSL